MSAYNQRILIRKLFRILVWIVFAFIGLFLVITILLQIPAIQTRIIQRITSQVSKRVETPFTIDKVAIRFPKSIGLKGIYAEDQKGDTLLFVEGIFVDVGMFALLRNKVRVNRLDLYGVTGNMLRLQPDSVYNFQFLIDAFAVKQPVDSVDVVEIIEDQIDKKNEPAAWKIDIRRVTLDDIRFKMIDHHSGISLMVNLKEFSTNLAPSNLLEQQYLTKATHIDGIDVDLNFSAPTVVRQKDSVVVSLPMVGMESLELNDFHLGYQSFNGTSFDLAGKEISIDPRLIDLNTNSLDINEIRIDELVAILKLPEPVAQPTEPAATQSEEIPDSDSISFAFDFASVLKWQIILDDLRIEKSDVTMKRGILPAKNSFNPSDMHISDVNIHIQNVEIGPERINLNIDEISLNLDDKLQIVDLSADISLDDKSKVNIKSFETASSHARFSLESDGSFLRFDQSSIQDQNIHLSMDDISIQDDFAWLVPAMNDFYFGWPGNKGIQLSGGISGTPNDLVLDNLSIEGPGFFEFRVIANLKSILKPDSISGSIETLQLLATPGAFFQNMPDSLKPKGIELPEWVSLRAFAEGSASGFDLSATMGSNFGALDMDAQWINNQENPENYTLTLKTDGFEVGHLIQNDTLLPQPTAVHLTLAGSGIKPESASATANIVISELQLFDHIYEDLLIDAGLRDSTLYANSTYEDDALSYKLKVAYGLFREEPDADIQLDLLYAMLHELGFSKDEVLVKTNISGEFIFEQPDFPTGELVLEEIGLAVGGEVYELPEVYLKTSVDAQEYSASVRSRFLASSYRGTMHPAAISKELKSHASQYFSGITSYTEEYHDTLPTQTFDLNLRLLPDPIVSGALLPQLEKYDTLVLLASYNSRESDLEINLSWPNAVFNGVDLKGVGVDVSSTGGRLRYTAGVESILSGEILLRNMELQGHLVNDSAGFQLGIQDQDQTPLYNLQGGIHHKDSLFVLALDPENLMLNGESWNIPDNNELIFGNRFFEAYNFKLESKSREILLGTTDEVDSKTGLLVQIRNIDIGRLTDIAKTGHPMVGGLLDGEFTLIDMYGQPAFVADISLENLAFKGDTLGNLNLLAENPSHNLFELSATLKGALADLTIEGTYRNEKEPMADIDIEIQRIDIAGAEPFVAGAVTGLQGNITGNMNVSGAPDNPFIKGQLHIKDTRFRLAATNAVYHIDDEKIEFDKTTVSLNSFSLVDSTGKMATLNGKVDISELTSPEFDIRFTSSDFALLNLKPSADQAYHGQIRVDSDIRITGSLVEPVVEGRVKLNEGSRFTFFLPQSNPETIGSEGVVEFVDNRDTLFTRLANESFEIESSTVAFGSMDISLNVEIDPKTDVKIIIDQYAGDFVQVKGGGMLSLGIDPSGKFSLSGNYEMVSGEYLLTFYELMRKTFTIRDGSNIIWSGDPMGAMVDLTAIHSLRTSAANLFINDPGQTNNAELRRQYPFLVYLNMKGTLEEPEISFEIDMPAEFQNAMDGSIMSRINQINQNESERNKQVFALLLLGSFIQDNPLASSGNADLGTSARNSASQILTQQLNRLSDKFIKGVDINFEVESMSDFSGEGQSGSTQLQMEVSRNFFDERLRVSVGGNLELEDENRQTRNPSDIAGDFAIEYYITPSGNLKVKGFRMKNYADIIDDEVVETGVSLIFSRNYTRFRDLFRKEEKSDTIPEINVE